jgi:hypothetical protein
MHEALCEVAVRLQRTGSTIPLWMQTAADVAGSRFSVLSSTVTQRARIQRKRAYHFASSLTARAKSVIATLLRAAPSEVLNSLAWRRLATMRSSPTHASEVEERSTNAKSDGGGGEAGSETRASRNALSCIEPWRCRLPAVQTSRPFGFDS